MPAPEGNNFACGNKGGDGAPKNNDFAVGNKGGGAPVGNTNGLKHGIRAAPQNLESELTSAEAGFVDDFVEGYLEIAPFDEEDERVERLRMLGVMAIQERRGERIILAEGPSVESIAFVDDDGTEHTELKEHHLARFTSRLSRDVRMGLKDLGCLPSGGSDSTSKTLAEMLSEAGESDEQDKPIDVESSAVDDDEADESDESDDDEQSDANGETLSLAERLSQAGD